MYASAGTQYLGAVECGATLPSIRIALECGEEIAEIVPRFRESHSL